jgi:short-subunit dehydrogenase
MSRTAVIAGVGPGLGASLARRFVEEDCQVGLFARSTKYLVEQDRSSWTLELDLRPHVEAF